MKTLKIVRISTMLLTLSLFVSCSEDQTTAPPILQMHLLQSSVILKQKCLLTVLGHSVTLHQVIKVILFLESNVAYNNLVGVQSVLFPQYKRVEAGNSANSLIIKILKGEVSRARCH